MPDIVYEIFNLLGSLLRMLGMLVFGLGTGWLVLEVFRKEKQEWPLLVAVFLGFVGLSFGLAWVLYYNSPASLGMYGVGAGLAMFLWGIPKKKKEGKD